MHMLLQHAIDKQSRTERERQSQEREASPIRRIICRKPAKAAPDVKKSQARERKKRHQSRNIAGDKAGGRFSYEMTAAGIEEGSRNIETGCEGQNECHGQTSGNTEFHDNGSPSCIERVSATSILMQKLPAG